jgi:hypothetical protein
VRDGLSGVLVNHPAEFSATITALLEDEARRRELSAGAVTASGAFTWTATVRSFDRLLTGQEAADSGQQNGRPASLTGR